MNRSQLRSVALWALALGIALLALLLLWVRSMPSGHSLGQDAWAYSEWLINYQAGFVRRGLGGEVLHRLASGQDAFMLLNRWIFVQYAGLIGLFALLVLSAGVSAWSLVLVLLMPGGALAVGLWGGFYYRKEVFFFDLLLIQALCLMFASRQRAGPSMMMKSLFAVISYLGLCVSMLLHEGALFIVLPVTWLMWGWLGKARVLRAGRVLYLLLGLLMMVVVVRHKGDAQMAQHIWSSLTDADRSMLGQDVSQTAISALGWTLFQGLKMQLRLVATGQALYWMVPYVGSAAYLYMLGQQLVSEAVDRESRLNSQSVLALYAFVAVTILPLALLGWDWGRWAVAINQVVAICLITRCGVLRRQAVTSDLDVPDVSRFARGLWATGSLGIVAIVLSVITRIPECCMTGLPASNITDAFKVVSMK